MILMHDSICKQNVLSKKDTFYYKDMNVHLMSFMKQVREQGAHPKGDLFYVLNNVPKEKIMKVEIFLPVKEEMIHTTKDFRFHSYFAIEDMMSIRIKDRFEENTEKAYAALFELVKSYNLEQVTGPFHVINNVDGKRFVTLKIGYRANI